MPVVSGDRKLPGRENIPTQIPGNEVGYVPVQILSLLESMPHECAKKGNLCYTMLCLLSSKSLRFFYIMLDQTTVMIVDQIYTFFF